MRPDCYRTVVNISSHKTLHYACNAQGMLQHVKPRQGIQDNTCFHVASTNFYEPANADNKTYDITRTLQLRQKFRACT